jgi:hypothetical protein
MRRTESKSGQDDKGGRFDTRPQKVVSLDLLYAAEFVTGDGSFPFARLCQTEPVIRTSVKAGCAAAKTTHEERPRREIDRAHS